MTSRTFYDYLTAPLFYQCVVRGQGGRGGGGEGGGGRREEGGGGAVEGGGGAVLVYVHLHVHCRVSWV